MATQYNLMKVLDNQPKGDATTHREDTHADDGFTELHASSSFLADAFYYCLFPLSLVNGCFVVQARQSVVILNCGHYTRSESKPGCHCYNCWGSEIRRISTAEQSMNVPMIQITEAGGSPIQVSANLIFRYSNPQKALLNIQNPNSYILQQAQGVLRRVCSSYPYESHDGSPSLRSTGLEVSRSLIDTLQPLLERAGVTISRFYLDEMRYSPEVAQMMLKTQQARALVQAREVIVQGAVSIAVRAVEELELKKIVLTSSEKAHLVSNLLTVTCSDSGEARPVLNL